MIPEWALYAEWRDAFEDVMDERYYTLDWLDMRLLNGDVRFWGTDSAAIIAEIKDYPTGAKDVHGLIAAGDLREIIQDLIPKALAWGREQGCTGAIIQSRQGWAKMLPDWEPHQFTIYREL